MNTYLHIPFCGSFCSYCDFTSFIGKEGLLPAYVDALGLEIGRSDLRGPLRTVYFGGGTPSKLDGPQVASLLRALEKKAGIAADAEVSLEANPETVDPAKLKAYRDAGVTRLSFGAQSSLGALLELLSRRHDWGQVGQAVRWARLAGFERVNLDLMIGLPGQDIPTVQRTLQDALALEPDHLSIYALEVVPGTPLARRVEGGLPIPSDDETADQYELVQTTLKGSGFLQYEVSNFCRPGRECAHNLAVWQGEDYWGFGTAAVGTQGNVRRTNGEDLEAYLGSVGRGEDPGVIREEIPPGIFAFERLMLKLRTARGAPQEEVEEALRDLPPSSRDRFERSLREGWLVREAGRVHPTSSGFFRLNGLLETLMPPGPPK